MKAAELIKFPNLRGLKDGFLIPGHESYFSVPKGQDIEPVMKENGFTDEEVAEFKMRILKGNPQWLVVESPEDKKDLQKANSEKAKVAKRKEELFALNKKEQVHLLQKLGVKEKEAPISEVDRVELIMKLEK